MAIRPHTVQVPGGSPVVIYAETANISFFVGGALTPDSTDGVTNGQVGVSGSSRSQYPGDPTPYNVGGSSREYLIDPTRKSGNALPGKNFVLAQYDEDGILLQKRQFTYKGRWIDLHAFLSASVSGLTYAYNNSGARYTMGATEEP